MILKKLVFDELEIRVFFIFQLLVVFPAPLILLQCRIQDCIGSCYLCIDNYYSNIGNCPYLMKITVLPYRQRAKLVLFIQASTLQLLYKRIDTHKICSHSFSFLSRKIKLTILVISV